MVLCRLGYEETRRCPKKYFLINIYATSTDEICGIENGLEQLGLTDQMDNMTVWIDNSKPGKLHIAIYIYIYT